MTESERLLDFIKILFSAIVAIIPIVPIINSFFDSTNFALGDSFIESHPKKSLHLRYGFLQIATYFGGMILYIFSLRNNINHLSLIKIIIYIEFLFMFTYFFLRPFIFLRKLLQLFQKIIPVLGYIIFILSLLFLGSILLYWGLSNKILLALTYFFFMLSSFFLVFFVSYDIERKPIMHIFLHEPNMKEKELIKINSTKESFVCLCDNGKTLIMNKYSSFKIEIICDDIKYYHKKQNTFLLILVLFLFLLILRFL